MRAKKQFDQTKCSGNNMKTCSLDAFIEMLSDLGNLRKIYTIFIDYCNVSVEIIQKIRQTWRVVITSHADVVKLP